MFRTVAFWIAAFACAIVPAQAQTRGEIALALAEPIARCVERQDTQHPAFHGCIDWHSAVHGTWALLAVTRLSGDKRHMALIDAVLTVEKLAREQRDLADDVRFEMPYGRAWFLRLAIEDRATTGSVRLADIAGDIAESLVQHYTAHAPNPHARDYDSASWALLNLYDYAVAVGRDDIAQRVRALVRAHFLIAEPCDPARDLAGGFMAVCSNWAWLVARVLPPAEFAPWLARFMPAPEAFVPVTRPISVHQYGLNFSRAWGLAGLYRATGDTKWRAAAAAHFDLAYGQRAWWDGDYRRVGHWVAQFGVFALAQQDER